jgi:Uma2 family endonuclease
MLRLYGGGHLISVEEYLHTDYSPDCDYVGGFVRRRSLGRYDHSTLQMLILMALQAHSEEWGILVRPELRLKIREGRYRVPDVVVLSKDTPRSAVIEHAPLLCIEVVSPDDRMPEVPERCRDYFEMGVPETWVLDPGTKRSFVVKHPMTTEVAEDAVLRSGPIELTPGALFAQL